MIVGVISDTHGRCRLMHRVVDELTATHGAECLFHLGDDYEDALELRAAGHTVHAVPGLWCDAYQQTGVPRTLVVQLDWLGTGCAHAEKDLTPREKAAPLVLFGHTHAPAIRTVGHSVWMNPGHLKGERDRGEPASYAVVEVVDDGILVRIHGLAGDVRDEARFDRQALTGG